MGVMALQDCDVGELVYTYTIIFCNGFDVAGNVIGTAWELQMWSPLVVVGFDADKVWVICERGLVDLHESIIVADRPDPEWYES